METIAVLAVMGIIIAGGVTGLSWTMRKIKVESNIKDMNLVAVDIFSEPVNFARTNIDQGIVFRGMNSSEQTATKTAEDMFAVSMSGLDLSVCEDMFEQARHYEMIHESTFTQADRCANGRAVFYYQLDSHVTDNQGCGYGMVWDETAGMCCRSLTLPESNECRIYTMVNASAGVCPDYTQTNLSGPCGTNGYCNNGACVSCPASTESCSIDADEYDPATQCLMTKKVVCGENEVCEGDICVCAEGYELYEGVCLEACEGSGMTGLRDENGNCLCLEGTNAETCACPTGYIYLDGACQRFECRGSNAGLYDCYLNNYRCGLNCTDSLGKNCNQGFCYPEQCRAILGETALHVPLEQRYGCQLPGGPLICYPIDNQKNWRCADTNHFGCCSGPSFGECYLGSCDPTSCDILNGKFMQVFYYKGGCRVSDDNGNVAYCYTEKADLSQWRCMYEISSTYTCGICSLTDLQNRICTATQSDGTISNCFEDVNCPEDMYWDSSARRCVMNDQSFSCKLDANCYYGLTDQKCGGHCSKLSPSSCIVGLCDLTTCSELDMTYEYSSTLPSTSLYGCSKTDENGNKLFCVKDDSSQNGAKCFYNGELCGSNGCNYDGTECPRYYMDECAPKGICVYNQEITADCTCDGVVSNGYCCPSGHTYLNGGCTLVTCPEGQEADESGICRDKN